MIRYVTVRPNGSVCGPMGEDFDFVKKALIIGYKNTVIDAFYKKDEEVWEHILKLGYQIKKAKIKVLEEK